MKKIEFSFCVRPHNGYVVECIHLAIIALTFLLAVVLASTLLLSLTIAPILSLILIIGCAPRWTISLSQEGQLFFYKGRPKNPHKQPVYETSINRLIRLQTIGDMDSGYIKRLSFVFADKKVAFKAYTFNPEYRMKTKSITAPAKFFKSLLSLQKELIFKNLYHYNSSPDNQASITICRQYFEELPSKDAPP